MEWYHEVAIGSHANRGVFYKKSELPKLIKNEGGREPVHLSVYQYPAKDIEYLRDKRSVSEFNGLRRIEWVPIDIDIKKNSEAWVWNKTTKIVEKLLDMGASDANLRLFYSGTGFHIMVHAESFGFKKHELLPAIVKMTMKNIAKEMNLDFDIAIYAKAGMLRAPYSVNQKTGFYKVPLKLAELYNGMEYIKMKSTERHMDFKYGNEYGEGELARFLAEDIKESIILSPTAYDPMGQLPYCIHQIIEEGPQEGERHEKLLRLLSDCKRRMSLKAASWVIRGWNNNSLSDAELERMIHNVYRNPYQYGCKDAVLAKRCSKKCKYYRHKNYANECISMEEAQQDLNAYADSIKASGVIRIGEMYGRDKKVIITPGELFTIQGGTGSNKTTLMWDIILGYDAINDVMGAYPTMPTLVLSLENTTANTSLMALCKTSGIEKDDILEMTNEDRDTLGAEMKARYFDHVAIRTVAPTMEEIERIIDELQPRLVFVDYIDLVDPAGLAGNDYSAIKTAMHGLSNLATNKKIMIGVISQINRESENLGKVKLTSGKGSGAIEAASRKVFGLEIDRKSDCRQLEMLKDNYNNTKLFGKVNLVLDPYSMRLTVRKENE